MFGFVCLSVCLMDCERSGVCFFQLTVCVLIWLFGWCLLSVVCLLVCVDVCLLVGVWRFLHLSLHNSVCGCLCVIVFLVSAHVFGGFLLVFG